MEEKKFNPETMATAIVNHAPGEHSISAIIGGIILKENLKDYFQSNGIFEHLNNL